MHTHSQPAGDDRGAPALATHAWFEGRLEPIRRAPSVYGPHKHDERAAAVEMTALPRPERIQTRIEIIISLRPNCLPTKKGNNHNESHR